MRTLIFDYPQPALQSPKDAAPAATRVLGSTVYASAVARALVQYGTYDEYYHLERNPLAGPKRDTEPMVSGARHASISIGELDRFRHHEHLVLMTPRSSPQGLVSVRSLLGEPPRPITACIHTLSGITAPYLALGLLFGNLNAHDAVLCSTYAGKRVLEQLLDLAIEVIHVKDRPRVRLPVIPLGTDCKLPKLDKGLAREQLAIPTTSTVLLYIGRFSTSSKCDLGPLLVTFARHLHDRNNGTRLVIAGDDTEHRMTGVLKEWCKSLGCETAVTILPDISDLQRRELLAAADVFVSFSDNIQETFGLSIIEAMAAGLPVVASDWDGYRELVKPGITGFLVPTAWPALGAHFNLTAPPAIAETLNAVLATATIVDCDAAADFLKVLIANPSLRLEMGAAAAREAHLRFDWSVIVGQYEELWLELLREARTPSACARLHVTGPLTYRVQEIFGGYPTDVILDETTLALTKIGEWWLAQNLHLDPIPGTPAGFVNETLRQLAEVVMDAGFISFGALLRSQCCSGASDLSLRLHIGRLMKYGIVRAVRSNSPS